MTESTAGPTSARFSPRRIFRSLGPALIVACVVLGPGSILTSSKVGCQFGYQLVWVLAIAGFCMAAAVAAAARIGATMDHTPCEEIARRWGRGAAILIGLCVFLITACFQYSNNLGVLAAIEPLAPLSAGQRHAVLVLLNVGIAACLFGLKRLYAPLEKLMMLMVGLMIVGFAANMAFARPDLMAVLSGLVPSLPEELQGSLLPRRAAAAAGGARLVDPWLAVQGLTATTFSAAGAFYQAYLVREKGWSQHELREGLVDSMVGTAVLVGISLLIMTTSAAVLAGRVTADELTSVAEVARQLDPLFGVAGKWLFCVGIFAGALSSFLVNSMIGGALLADGLGYRAGLDAPATKAGTTAVLLVGMGVAIGTDAAGRVDLIVFAQAMTVLGGPLLTAALIYLLAKARTEHGIHVPVWIRWMLGVGAVIACGLALRTAWRLVLDRVV